jgi:hypothetical protein
LELLARKQMSPNGFIEQYAREGVALSQKARWFASGIFRVHHASGGPNLGPMKTERWPDALSDWALPPASRGGR